MIVSLTLTEEATELVRQARRSLLPTGTDRQRVHVLLQTRLNVGTGLAGVQTRALSNVSAAFGTTLVGGLLLVALSVPIVHVVRRAPSVVFEPVEALPARMRLAIDLLPPIDAEVSAPVLGELPESAVVPRARFARSELPFSNDRLARESELLMRAEAEYHAGRSREALTFVEAHARAFPQGVLKPERVQLKAKLQCQLAEPRDVDSVQRTRHADRDTGPCRTTR